MINVQGNLLVTFNVFRVISIFYEMFIEVDSDQEKYLTKNATL